jgi:hypothetical protein
MSRAVVTRIVCRPVIIITSGSIETLVPGLRMLREWCQALIQFRTCQITTWIEVCLPILIETCCADWFFMVFPSYQENAVSDHIYCPVNLKSWSRFTMFCCNIDFGCNRLQEVSPVDCRAHQHVEPSVLPVIPPSAAMLLTRSILSAAALTYK